MGSNDIVKKGKTILNATNPKLLDVCVITLEKIEGEAHYILKFGNSGDIRIVGREQWESFVEFLQWFDWNSEDTEEYDFHDFNIIPYAQEVFSDITDVRENKNLDK